jgi:oligoendopeptidase F
MFAEFEKIIHQEAEKGNPLTPEVLNKIYHDLNHEYYGPDMVIDGEIDLEWARIPHFYYNFYVYKYATGFSAATALAERILKEEPGAIEQYLNFLKSGDSDYPINLLKSAGVDMTTAKPIESAINTFNKYVNQLESLS